MRPSDRLPISRYRELWKDYKNVIPFIIFIEIYNLGYNSGYVEAKKEREDE